MFIRTPTSPPTGFSGVLSLGPGCPVVASIVRLLNEAPWSFLCLSFRMCVKNTRSSLVFNLPFSEGESSSLDATRRLTSGRVRLERSTLPTPCHGL